MHGRSRWACQLLAILLASCGPADPPPLPPDSFAFGVFGDRPYYFWERGRFQRVLADVSDADVEWLLHVGDILWYPCSDEAFEERLTDLNSVRHPVIYTPGDNEWTDCHEDRPGRYEPLGRLSTLRRIFFSRPEASLGTRTMPLESQGADSTFTTFVENARWKRGGFVFATIHLVGSGNASHDFPGRTAEDDREVTLRTEAAIDWLEGAFSTAHADSASGIVLVVHANPGLERGVETSEPHAGLVDRLVELVIGFAGPVLLIHGDSHDQRVDHPLRNSETGEPLANFTRLETYGSPDIGWVRVVIDSVAGRIVECEPRLMRPRLLW